MGNLGTQQQTHSHWMDAQLLRAVGALAHAPGLTELASPMARIVRETTSASEVRIFWRPDEEHTYRDLAGTNAATWSWPEGHAEGCSYFWSPEDLERWRAESWIAEETERAAAWPMGAGAVLLTFWTRGHQPDQGELELLEAVAQLAARALDHHQISSDLAVLADSRTQSLQALNEEMETFAYTMSHDLKTPLTVLKTSLWTLRQLLQSQLDDRGRLAMDRLEFTVERMRGQVNGMLHMYRLTKDDLRPATVNISALAREVVESLRVCDPARRVEVVLAEGIRVRGDAAMLHVVMENLLDNAWKYTARQTSARIEVGEFRDDHRQLVIFVKDNGAGFDPDKKDRLFNVFQRLHTDDEFQGSGIGLASVQRIINKHGGRVWGEGQPGKGAAFFFTLPDELPASEASGTGDPEAAGGSALLRK